MGDQGRGQIGKSRAAAATGALFVGAALSWPIFLGFVFAYFYLRSLNSHGLWRPSNVDPPQTIGILVTLAMRRAISNTPVSVVPERLVMVFPLKSSVPPLATT